jgi:prepilin-type N-terminal cleavage/methylation domain-containing protein
MTKQSGFTLVELAIVLMIIGLLIGGILKGQELINNTRVLNTIRQVKSYHTAYITFQDSYGAVAGDIVNPGSRIPNCTASPCNISGNGSGKFETDEELYNFWLHLAKANLITGIDTSYTAVDETPGVSVPATAFGKGTFRISPYINGHTMAFNNDGYGIKLPNAAQIDRKMDDGIANRGGVILDDYDLAGASDPPTSDYAGSPNIGCGMYFFF